MGPFKLLIVCVVVLVLTFTISDAAVAGKRLTKRVREKKVAVDAGEFEFSFRKRARRETLAAMEKRRNEAGYDPLQKVRDFRANAEPVRKEYRKRK